ncbi:MAG: TatD family hydrolase, partial [Bacteroidaceae bacterium]|nr:TatD family hydrolase [Bacteroidaceae bacterium]
LIVDIRRALLSPPFEGVGEGFLAIGECGLDAVRGPSMDIQEEVFLRQVALSEELGKPLVIHCVKAIDRLLLLRRQQHPTMPWMFHGFRGKPQQLRSLIDAGFYVSFGFNHNEESLCLCPIERMMLETDECLSSIVELYNNVARKRSLEEAVLCQAMTQNYRIFFRKEPIHTLKCP